MAWYSGLTGALGRARGSVGRGAGRAGGYLADRLFGAGNRPTQILGSNGAINAVRSQMSATGGRMLGAIKRNPDVAYMASGVSNRIPAMKSLLGTGILGGVGGNLRTAGRMGYKAGRYFDRSAKSGILAERRAALGYGALSRANLTQAGRGMRNWITGAGYEGYGGARAAMAARAGLVAGGVAGGAWGVNRARGR